MKHLKKTLLTLVALLGLTTGAWAQYPIVYDFEAAANAEENPANKNGSLANGQAFYGWENANNTDTRRQDYKGYEWADGSVLPEVCHVWRRSDRINGNVAGNGGLKCPSNKEMAIDGLDVGYKVTIIYDATNAAEGNKEIVWAIGDGYFDATLDKPRATATINGAEAVPGQTTIESGDVITVSSVTPAENGTGYIVFAVKKGMVIKKIIVEAPTLVEGFSWDAATKTGTINQMPAGNVTVFVNYYAQAKAADGAVTAAEDAQATTDTPLVTIDETKLTGASGLMYFVSETETAPAYDAEGWTDVLPTAESFTEAKTVYVWYYPVGADDEDPAKTYSDGDMNATALAVTLLPEPTYNVTFAEGVNPEPPADPIWTATPNTDVKKGDKVTVTYTGERKVIGVKAEKKTKVYTMAADATAEDKGKLICADGHIHAYNEDAECTAARVAKIIYLGTTGHATYTHGLALALEDVSSNSLSWDNSRSNNNSMTAAEWCSACNTSKAVTGATWLLASKDQWDYMLGANGAGSYTALRDGFTSVGGTNMQSVGYWSSTEDSSNALIYGFGSGSWYSGSKDSNYNVRACIAF